MLTTLINSILNNEFVTMSADSMNSDKKWSFHLWLMQRSPTPSQIFEGGGHEAHEVENVICQSLVIFVSFGSARIILADLIF